jgi:hypothetical protein
MNTRIPRIEGIDPNRDWNREEEVETESRPRGGYAGADEEFASAEGTGCSAQPPVEPTACTLSALCLPHGMAYGVP